MTWVAHPPSNSDHKNHNHHLFLSGYKVITQLLTLKIIFGNFKPFSSSHPFLFLQNSLVLVGHRDIRNLPWAGKHHKIDPRWRTFNGWVCWWPFLELSYILKRVAPWRSDGAWSDGWWVGDDWIVMGGSPQKKKAVGFPDFFLKGGITMCISISTIFSRDSNFITILVFFFGISGRQL